MVCIVKKTFFISWLNYQNYDCKLCISFLEPKIKDLDTNQFKNVETIT